VSAQTLYAQKFGFWSRKTLDHAKRAKTTAALCEAFWFGTCFALFIALGPFAALAALFGVFSLAPVSEAEEPPRLD